MKNRTNSVKVRRAALALLTLLVTLTGNRLIAGCITGLVVEDATGESINWTTVRIPEINRAEQSHDNGRFQFCEISPGDYKVTVSALGFRTELVQVHLNSEQDTVDLLIKMVETSLQLDEVVVVSQRLRAFGGLDPSRTISGTRLQQNLRGTLAATITNEPGVAQTSMGPATARPVVRGMGGDRLEIMEGGASTGDASSISNDHAVAVDPLGTERIDILRGPAVFLYSSNAIGGVINIDRENRLANLPDQVHGTLLFQGGSVNSELTGGAALRVPLNPVALFLRGSYRNAGDMTAGGTTLENTDLKTIDGSAGIRLPYRTGSAGLETTYYQNHYGIPGGFVGAHPDGVRIEMRRRQYAADAEINPTSSFIQKVKLESNYTNYYHRELESGNIVGTEYGLLTTAGSLQIHHKPVGNVFDNGIVSLQGSLVDFAANGVRIPQTNERSIGLSLFEEKSIANFKLTGAARFDLKEMIPSGEDSTSAGFIRERRFTGLSGGVTTSWSPGLSHETEGSPSPLSLGLTLSRTWRVPSIEELYSDGPHLAAYSYEVGNADLQPEEGITVELNGTLSSDRGHLTGALFRNQITNYVIPQATGETNFRTMLPLYRHTGSDVLLFGAELEFEWNLFEGLTGSGSVSWIQGEERETKHPLPAIPPLNGMLSLRHQQGIFASGIIGHWSGAQTRVGEFEEPTDGYVTFDIFGQMRLNSTSTFHTIILGIDNLFDSEYRNHLSRIKSIAPEPGRSVTLLYRMGF
ncbi:MAG: TonB-dependent receptor [Ignavibacteriae bacterium]|nr:TonB-dependent receptor [Ignavibacteriota bacterium]MCB9216223.1 TonB-dependent receptor [Ignavibacteria bacterium]